MGDMGVAMGYFFRWSGILLTALLPSVSAAELSGVDCVLSTPAGTQMRYTDNHGKYTMTFFGDGRYRFVSVSQNETMADSREGRWEYEVSGRRTALLHLDGDSVIRLEFSAPLVASGTIDDDVRIYRFHFTRTCPE